MKYDPQRVADIVQAMKEDRFDAWHSFRFHWPMHVFEFAKTVLVDFGGGFVYGVALGLAAVIYGLEVLAA